jgi:hypothetical protein
MARCGSDNHKKNTKFYYRKNVMILNNVKIFDKNNPNFVISNTDKEITELINNKDIPITIYGRLPLEHLNPVKTKTSYHYLSNKEKICGINIGIIKNVTKIENNIFYGTVFLFQEYYKDSIFNNYEVQVNDDMSIKYIETVEFKIQ